MQDGSIIAKNVLMDGPMICGSYEAEIRTYRKAVDKSGCVWLIANQPNEADNIYVHDPRDKNSQGFAGRTLTFKLEDGSEYQAMGPWHTNSDALFAATGIDVRNKCFTQIAIGLKIGEGFIAVGDVIYHEQVAVLGSYERFKSVASSIANNLGRPVKYAMRGHGGGSGGWIYPDSYTKEQIEEFFKDKSNWQ